MGLVPRILIGVSLAINAVLVVCVAVLFAAQSDTSHKAEAAQRTANQAVKLSVDQINRTSNLDSLPDQVVEMVNMQAGMQAQLQAMCDWAATASFQAKKGSDLARALTQFQTQVCSPP
jgi:Tfp pilus assembly protein PilO